MNRSEWNFVLNFSFYQIVSPIIIIIIVIIVVMVCFLLKLAVLLKILFHTEYTFYSSQKLLCTLFYPQ